MQYLKLILVILCALMISATWNSAFSAQVSQVQIQSYTCDGFRVVLQQTGKQPISASIIPEDGVWIEIPNNDESDDNLDLYLYNIANSKLAVMGIKTMSGAPQLMLWIYRDFDFYRANKAQYQLRCNKQ